MVQITNNPKAIFNLDQAKPKFHLLLDDDVAIAPEASLSADQLTWRLATKYDNTPIYNTSKTHRIKGNIIKHSDIPTRYGNGYIDDGYNVIAANYTDEIQSMKNDGWNINDDFLNEYSSKHFITKSVSFKAKDYANWHMKQYDLNKDGLLQYSESPGAFKVFGIK